LNIFHTNWERGAQEKDYVIERLRHAHKHLRKAMYEIERGVPMKDDDLAAVAVNCMFAMFFHPIITQYNYDNLGKKKESPQKEPYCGNSLPLLQSDDPITRATDDYVNSRRAEPERAIVFRGPSNDVKGYSG
jgi:hypothetical protein